MTVCPHCQNQARLLFQTHDINRRLSDATFDYFRCEVCKLIFLSPVPDDLGSYYQRDYYKTPTTLEGLAGASARYAYKLDTVRRFKAGGKALEIGAGYGDFLYQLKQAGFEAEGIEMDAGCCQFVEAQLGLPMTNTQAPLEALRGAGQYDVIAMWHVIEHLPGFGEILQEAAAHLQPDGILILAAPNPDALQFRLFGRYWAHVDAPRHVQLIPMSLLEAALLRNGLRLVFASTCAEGQQAEQFGWIKSLMNRLNVFIPPSEAQPAEGDVPRSPKYRLMRGGMHVAVQALMAVTRPFICRRGQGSSYTLVFQKSNAG